MSVGLQVRLGQCHAGGADSARAARRRQRDVVRVGGRAVADQLGQDLDAAPAGVAELFEHEHAGALGDDEAVAALVERPARARRDRRCASTARASRAKAPTSGSKTGASEPPATMMSASPRMIVSAASPMAWPAVAQADDGGPVGAASRRS